MTFDFKQLNIKINELNKHTKHLPQRNVSKTAEVYILKVTPKLTTCNDYRIDYTDTKNFTVHRTLFYKNEVVIKSVDRQWKRLKDFTDLRANMWDYWYTIDEDTIESVYYIPSQIIVNDDKKVKERFLRDSTLRKIKR